MTLAKTMMQATQFDFSALSDGYLDKRSSVTEIGRVQGVFNEMMIKFAGAIKSNKSLAAGLPEPTTLAAPLETRSSVLHWRILLLVPLSDRLLLLVDLVQRQPTDIWWLEDLWEGSRRLKRTRWMGQSRKISFFGVGRIVFLKLLAVLFFLYYLFFDIYWCLLLSSNL
ncbi:hypothetical protein BC829DRAFT_245608 [Chytridium lagenaria]|nr:hypothetical protein BC829DRAFT_245608 [Chytridium lagenaria]